MQDRGSAASWVGSARGAMQATGSIGPEPTPPTHLLWGPLRMELPLLFIQDRPVPSAEREVIVTTKRPARPGGLVRLWPGAALGNRAAVGPTRRPPTCSAGLATLLPFRNSKAVRLGRDGFGANVKNEGPNANGCADLDLRLMSTPDRALPLRGQWIHGRKYTHSLQASNRHRWFNVR